MDFNNFDWHDSTLSKIIIDRSNPGKIDIIQLDIIWPDETKSSIVFKDVYWAKLLMGFGVIASESISHAYLALPNDKDLVLIKSKWDKFMNKELYCYVIKTASTGSEIKIISCGFQIFNLP